MSHSQAQRDRLFYLHQNLVHSIAWRLHRRSAGHVAIDDLIAYGQLGLLEAIQGFDDTRGNKFSTYAWYRVRGAIFDGLGKMAWFSRAAYERGDYETTSHSPDAGAKETNSSSDSRSSIAGQWPTVLGGDTVASLTGDAAVEANAMHHELVSFLRDLVCALPEKEAGLIQGTFFEGRTLTEAARRVGISTAWASRLQARTLADLRVSLEAAGFGAAD